MSGHVPGQSTHAFRSSVAGLVFRVHPAVPAWELILRRNQVDVDYYKDCILRLFRQGGGKGANHFYYGAPSSGKTALTRPVLVFRSA